MKKYIIFILLFINLATGSELKIAAAANNRSYFNELIKEFNKKYPDIKLIPTFGASGVLNLQIQKGADYDIFMSANIKFAKNLFDEKIAKSEPFVYAKGKLALFSTKELDFSKGIDLLKDENIKTITIANPKTAPFGKASIDALKNAKIYEDVKNKLIKAKNISDALLQTINASDVGFVAGNFLYMPDMKKYQLNKNFIFIDKSLYNPIAQSVVIIKPSDDADKFIDFLKSDEAKNILKNFGYEVD